MTLLEKAYRLRSAAQCLEQLLIGAETTNQRETKAEIWCRMRDKVEGVELDLRLLRAAVQSRKRAACDACVHEGVGDPHRAYDKGVLVFSKWKCRFCREWTTVGPKPAAVQG